MKLSDFHYELPPELIAQHPAKNRQGSRLLVLDKHTGSIKHDFFSNISGYISKGDCLVFNDTKVIPARLYGKKSGTDGAIEIVLLKCIKEDIWEVLTRPGRRASPGTVFIFGENNELAATVLSIAQDGNRIVRFEYEGVFMELLDKLGRIPLPPYIKEEQDDMNRYQTVYAKYPGSAAAPTAGLHFTEGSLGVLSDKGVGLAFLTLHIGLGTFRPVKTEDIKNHRMHSEEYYVPKAASELINSTKENGKRIICVGTTSCRALESMSDENGYVRNGSASTDIFIYPGYRFKVMDSIITNFHLPESTLLMLVSAFAGRENVLLAYNEAINKKYRFFSFGDAMMITDTGESFK